MLSIQINTMAMLLSEFDFLPIYRADLAGSRTLSFTANDAHGMHDHRNRGDKGGDRRHKFFGKNLISVNTSIF